MALKSLIYSWTKCRIRATSSKGILNCSANASDVIVGFSALTVARKACCVGGFLPCPLGARFARFLAVFFGVFFGGGLVPPFALAVPLPVPALAVAVLAMGDNYHAPHAPRKAFVYLGGGARYCRRIAAASSHP